MTAELEGGDGGNPSQVSRDRVGEVDALEPEPRVEAEAELMLELPPALRNEVEARILLGGLGNTREPGLARRRTSLDRGGT
jgi:hypothetical protein